MTFRRTVNIVEHERPTVVDVDVYRPDGARLLKCNVRLELTSGQRLEFSGPPEELLEIATMLLEALRAKPRDRVPV